MTRYSVETDEPEKCSKSRGSHLRIHYKHAREIAAFTKGKNAQKMITHLERVCEKTAIIPFTKYTGGIGRKGMAKTVNAPGDKGRWPIKASIVYADLLRNAMANAETKGLDVDALIVSHAQVNRAPAGRRRTYRAHGRIGKYASQPAHIEIILKEKAEEGVQKADDDAPPVRVTKKMAAQRRFIKVGQP